MAHDIHQDRIEMKAGTTFSKTWPVNDSDDADGTGNTPYDFDAEGALVEAEARTAYDGDLIVRFASDGSGSANTEASWDDVGNLTLRWQVPKGASPVPSGVWDCIITDSDGDITPVLEGPAFVTQEVTTGG